MKIWKRKLLAISLALGIVFTGCASDFGQGRSTEPDGSFESSSEQSSSEQNSSQPSPNHSEAPSWTAGLDLSEAIQPLGIMRKSTEIESVDRIEPYSEWWEPQNNAIQGDLSQSPALAYSFTFSDKTVFPDTGNLPAGYDPDALMEWGKDPGLNVDILHKHGFTGKGAVIAYVDQPAAPHEQYGSANLHYTNNTENESSMHGPAVLSLLSGKDIGTAPEAEVYFYGMAAWELDQTKHAQCLYQIIEQNKQLPEDKKIRMVAFSDNINTEEKHPKEFRKAVTACEEAGIMVWFCGEYGCASFLPFSDKNLPENVIEDAEYREAKFSTDLVYVPTSGRTVAATEGSSYIYWGGNGGASWAMPYVFGLYAIAIEIDPALTQYALTELVASTAYDCNGIKLVNPVGFISAVLRRVGRDSEADAMIQEVRERARYIYAVMDTKTMAEEDLNAVGSYLSSITDATILVADASFFAGAGELYAALQADADQRGGIVAGVQIFGTPDMVPSFPVQYKVQMVDGIDEGGLFLTDLFYGNFDNRAEDITSGYNVMDHFAQGKDIKLVPQWPAVRLPLSKGEFSAFLSKYQSYVRNTGLVRQELVNFSNPIFNDTEHVDDMGRFLKRMDQEFQLLDIPYRLYGNLDGQAAVTTEVLGDFTAENLAMENDNGMMELLINSHGQRDNIDQCIFENNREKRVSLVNMDTINAVLDGNPYYLDCWTCLNGYGMTDNLITAALKGQCVGAFAATSVLSNNGVHWDAGLEEMAKSNFYYFYYHYLKALHKGEMRSRAFFAAQQAYGKALMADSSNTIRRDGNYQFNLCNLLTYHNFGVIEPARSWPFFDAGGYIPQAGQSVPKVQRKKAAKRILLTDGAPIGGAKPLEYAAASTPAPSGFTIRRFTIQALDNQYFRFTIEYTLPEEIKAVAVFNPPNGDDISLHSVIVVDGTWDKLVFDLSDRQLQFASSLVLNFYGNEISYAILPEMSAIRSVIRQKQG